MSGGYEFETVLALLGRTTQDGRALSAQGKWTFRESAPLHDRAGVVRGQMTEFNIIFPKIYVRGTTALQDTAKKLDAGILMLNPAWLDVEYWGDPLTMTMWFQKGTLYGARLVPAHEWAWA